MPVMGRICLDAGASTGGFTDVLLRRGARRVYAVDVGHGQLLPRLATDDRVVVMDRTNLRTLTSLAEPIDLATLDLSFISLRLVLAQLVDRRRARAAGRGDRVAQLRGMQTGAQGVLGGAEQRLRHQVVGKVAREAEVDAGVDERLHDREQVGRAGPRQRGGHRRRRRPAA